MTLTTLITTVTYSGNSTVDTDLDTAFQFYDNSQVRVTQITVATGAELLMVEGTDYEIEDHVLGGNANVNTQANAATVFTTNVHRWRIDRVSPLTQLLDFVALTNLPNAQVEEMGDRSVMADQERSVEIAALEASDVSLNGIINGDLGVWERGTSFVAGGTPHDNDDNNYIADRFRVLSESDDTVDITQELTIKPVGAPACIRFDVETGFEKFGVFQVLEAASASAFIGVPITFSFKARVAGGSSIDHLRAAIMYWTGTADDATVRDDPINVWGAVNVDPTLTGSWVYGSVVNPPTTQHPNLATLNTEFQTFTVSNILLPATATNIAIFVWTDDTSMTIGHFLYIGDFRLEASATAHAFAHRPFNEELLLCQRYFEAINGDAGFGKVFSYGFAETTASCHFLVNFKVRKLRGVGAADITISAIADFRIIQVGGAQVIPTAGPAHIGGDTDITTEIQISDIADPFTIGDIVKALLLVGADNSISWDAEL